jgi:hypothetical protein
MVDITPDFVRAVGKHFVSLSCVQHPLKGMPKILVFSGFVIEILGEWYYVTAGHILRDIQAAIGAGSKFNVWRLGDQTAGGRFKSSTIPYEFDESVWLIVEDSERGPDYATVHLGGIYRRPLEAGGVEALGKDAWIDHLTESDHWALIGIPSESVTYDGKSVITARLLLVPLVPADQPSGASTKSENQFYAKPVGESEQHFKNADGLSGGPVFSLKKVDHQWLYCVMGVQSAWYPSSRTLAICQIESFAIYVKEIVADALSARAKRADISPE